MNGIIAAALFRRCCCCLPAKSYKVNTKLVGGAIENMYECIKSECRPSDRIEEETAVEETEVAEAEPDKLAQMSL